MFPQMFLGKQNVSVTNSATFDVSHRAFLRYILEGLKLLPSPTPSPQPTPMLPSPCPLKVRLFCLKIKIEKIVLKLHEIKFREPRNTKRFWGRTSAGPQKPLVVVVSGSTKKSLKTSWFSQV